MSKQIEYIDTGVNWLGKIPSTWESKRIKMLTRVKRGASPRPIDNPIYFDEEGEFAWVRIADVTASERYLENTTQRLSELGSSLSVKRYPDDFFLSIAGTVGKPIITKIKCCIHDGFVYFPDLKINPEFLYYIFSTGLPYLGLGKMGTQLNLNTDTVGDIYIPIPDDNEIEKIVSFLDDKVGEIDKIISKKQKLIDCLKEEKIALITQAVTKGLSSKVSLKSSLIDWYPEIPEHWRIIKLKWISKIYSGGTPDKNKTEYWFDGNIPWLNSGSVNQFFITEASEYITEDGLNNSSAKWIEPNSIVIALAGQGKTKGMVGIVTFKVTCNQSMGVICPDKSVLNNKFLLYFLHINYFNLRGLSGEGIRDGLNLEMIGDIKITLPNLDEQEIIVSYIEENTTKIDNTIKKIEQEIDLIKEYRTSLINEVVTGKITLN